MQETIQSSRTKREKQSKKKHLLWLVPLLLLAAVYFGGVLFFSHNFLPNTTINGQNVGGKSIQAVTAIPHARTDNDTLSLVTMEGDTQEIPLSSFSYHSEYDSDLAALHAAQSSFLWPAALAGKGEALDVPLAVTFDDSALLYQLHALPCFSDSSLQPPVNAHIEKTDAGFTIMEAVEGNMLDDAAVWSAVTETLSAGDLTVDLAESNCYQKPTIHADDPGLREQMVLFKKYSDLNLTIDLTDVVETLSFPDFKDWLETDGQTITLNEESVKNYVTSLSKKYNTFETKRSFNATGVGTISVGGSGLDTYGFQLSIAKTEDALLSAMQNQESGTIQAVWRIPGHCRGASNGDIGSTYIEADLTRQHLWYYQNGALQLETDFVSGLASQPGRNTPTGVFRVWGKQRDRTLKGEDYESFVSYWMPFTWTGCGLHDAPWRGAFGGSIYKSNGSHGCLNLPPKAAASLYNMVAFDTPVIVYKS